MKIKIKNSDRISLMYGIDRAIADYIPLGLLVTNNSMNEISVITAYGVRHDISEYITVESNTEDQFTEIAMTKISDPLDEREGVWFDIAGITALRKLPPGTKIYIKKP